MTYGGSIMTVLKCKMCGGNIQISGASHGVCDSCGCEVTLPKIDDDKRADMYNRGNYFRQVGEFDRAYSAYEHIIADDPGDAEAHWCLTLCRYGVEYVSDPRTGDFKPTVSRMSYDPILNDPDYLAALAASDEYTKELYRREARKIDHIQRQYLENKLAEVLCEIVVGVVRTIGSITHKGNVRALESYEANVIRPLEESIYHDMKKRWSGKADAAFWIRCSTLIAKETKEIGEGVLTWQF